MFKLVVLSALLALAAAKPSLLHSPLVAPLHAAYVSSPSVSSYSTTVISGHETPAVLAAPAVSVYTSPLVSAYSAPVVAAYTPALPHNTPAVVQGLDGRPLDTIEVVNARAAHYTAKVFDHAHGLHKRSIHAPIAYTTVVAAPSAVSHQSRTDVHSSHAVVAAAPVVAAYSAPVVSAYSGPVVSAYSAPVVSAYSHHASPIVSSYVAPVAAYTPALPHGIPAVVQGLDGRPLDTIEVVNARAAHHTAQIFDHAHGLHKRSIHAPIAYTTVVAGPSAVSHQSRTDVHSSHAVVAAAPVVAAYSAPVVSAYSAPVVSAYSAPVVSAYSHHASPIVSSYVAPVAAYTPALPHGIPAVVQGLDGRPLDTIEVVNARAAHHTAQIFDHAHGLHKRSIHAPIAYTTVVAAPSAVSHQSRTDVHSSHAVVAAAPVFAAYSAPVVSAYSTPVVSAYSAPVVSAYSHHASPIVSSYVAPVAAYTPALPHGTPAVVQGLDGRPLDTIEVVNARAAHQTAQIFDHAHGLHKRSIHAPIVYTSVVAAPSAVSHQSRTDVHSSHAVVAAAPVVAAYSTPVVSAYSAPVVSSYAHHGVSGYVNPLVSAYSTPVVSAYGHHASPTYIHAL